MEISDYKLNKIFLKVQKPARYSGGEYNTPDMNKPCSYRLCFCFPDIYEIGMSNLGLQILYDIVNKKEGFIAERCFAPWHDMAQEMKKEGIPLFSLETKRPLKEFDAIGFSLQFELLYSNVLYMLDLAGIPFLSKDRDESYPLLIAGGPCAVNPEPFKDFFDIVAIGEGEKVIEDIIERAAEAKRQGLSKNELLKSLKGVDGIYIPSLHKKGERVKKAVLKDFESSPYPEKPLVPNIGVVHDRAVLELYRGCASGCRFCQAGFYYRPIREKSAKRLRQTAEEIIKNTGFEELSLCSLSTGDYSEIKDLIYSLNALSKDKSVRLSLPSLRLSGFEGEYAELSRKSSLTFAPEAGTQRLRNVINKNITEEDILNISKAFEAGYDSIKLYFMLGLPTETEEDLKGIAEICYKLKDFYFKVKGKRGLNISVSCSVFIPKPCTPFQWERQITIDEMLEKQRFLQQELRKIKGVSFSWHGAEPSKLEAALARGDEMLSDVIIKAYELGCSFDSWTECFDFEKWQQAFRESGLDMEEYSKAIDTEKTLPWDFIDTGVDKKYLLKERERAYLEEVTPSCRNSCRACGAMKLGRCTICS